MLDIKDLRNNFEEVKRRLLQRGNDYGIDGFLELSEKSREMRSAVEQLKAKQNALSKQVPQFKKEGKDTTELFAASKEIGAEITKFEPELKEIESKIENLMLNIPNLPHESVPFGKDEADNVEVHRWGSPTKFDFEHLPHWEIGENLKILDPARAAKVTGSRFTIYKGLGARLERAIINLMLDTHIDKHGYVEVMPPQMVNRTSMFGTCQLPKFEDDSFKINDTDYFLVPTAEVPITNMYRDEILDVDALPIKHCAYTACFRSEAGAAGRDNRGLIRQHQFNKVELVKFVKPENSYAELDKLVKDAANILEILELPFRIVTLCTGDMGFASAKTFDIEVYMPSYDRYVEISSCTNFETFQSRRIGIKYKEAQGEKAQLVHTINGSGLAAGRTTAAILENFQQKDGSVKIPKALVPYMGGVLEIR
ncbi:MAG: serine--tRNA ligase [Defluviitaleaceae bacterium]|nr:serine--tRNA ligase [Defluviitaleaceae bacterium]